jgi:hypothetical protein
MAANPSSLFFIRNRNVFQSFQFMAERFTLRENLGKHHSFAPESHRFLKCDRNLGLLTLHNEERHAPFENLCSHVASHDPVKYRTSRTLVFLRNLSAFRPTGIDASTKVFLAPHRKPRIRVIDAYNQGVPSSLRSAQSDENASFPIDVSSEACPIDLGGASHPKDFSLNLERRDP